MWHEARKQEKKLRGIMVDWKKRAERRRQYYENLATDPIQQLRIVGTTTKIHLNTVENSDGMMQWSGQPDILIDRFDARAHLDYLPEFESNNENSKQTFDDLQLNYERYKILTKNDFSEVPEDQMLQQIEMEEDIPFSVRKAAASIEAEKEKLSEKTASIGYQYLNKTDGDMKTDIVDDINEDDLQQLSSESNIDPDQLSEGQRDKLNLLANAYGIGTGTFCRFVREDMADTAARDKAHKEEAERLVKYGRRAIRHDNLGRSESNARVSAHSPLSYVRRASPTYEPYKRSVSRSESSERSGDEIKFITEFSSAGNTKDDGNKKSVNSREQLSSSSRHRQRKRSREYSADRYKDRYRSRDNSRERRRKYRSRSRSNDRGSSGKRSRYSRSRSSERRSRHRRHDSNSSGESSRYRKHKHRGRSRSRSPDHNRRRTHDSPSSRRSISPKKSSAIKTSKLAITPGKDTGAKKTLTRQEMLKVKMQRQLNKHLKNDRKMEKEKQEKKELERVQREDEIYDQQLRLKSRSRRSRSRSRSFERY